MAKTLTSEQVIELMRKRQGKRTAKEFAKELGIGEAYICDIYKGRREVGPTVLEALGLTRETIYRPNEKTVTA